MEVAFAHCDLGSRKTKPRENNVIPLSHLPFYFTGSPYNKHVSSCLFMIKPRSFSRSPLCQTQPAMQSGPALPFSSQVANLCHRQYNNIIYLKGLGFPSHPHHPVFSTLLVCPPLSWRSGMPLGTAEHPR